MRTPKEFETVQRKQVAAEGALMIMFQLVGKMGIVSLAVLPLSTNETVKSSKHSLAARAGACFMTVLAAFCVH